MMVQNMMDGSGRGIQTEPFSSYRVRHAFAVHGEIEKVSAMAELLKELGIPSAVAPSPGQTYKID